MLAQNYSSSYESAWRSLQQSAARLEILPKIGHYGISLTAGAVPGRKATSAHILAGKSFFPNDDWSQETQLKYGTIYKIIAISEDSNWLQVRLPAPNRCDVWIEQHRHQRIAPHLYRLLLKDPELTEPVSRRLQLVLLGDCEKFEPILIEPGTKLPLYDKNTQTCLGPGSLCRIEDPEPQVEINTTPTIRNLYKVVRNILGQSYTWGGLDCSAFIYNVYSSFRISLPQNSALDQSNYGRQILSLSEAKTGDCIFYGIGKISHVGILFKFSDGNYLAHAKQRVRIEKMQSDGLTKSYNGSGRHIMKITRFSEFE